MLSSIDLSSILLKYKKREIDLICILGPTASGKTRYAVELAERFNKLLLNDIELGFTQFDGTEIISADSRQVYRGMSIGTGKDLCEYKNIPYHLIDIRDAGEKYNIFQYQQDFEKSYKDIISRNRIPILCGGSGLYIEAATCGYSLPDVPVNQELRDDLETKEMEELIILLKGLKNTHNKSDYDSKKRLIRAIEIALYEKDNQIIHSNYLPKKTYYIGIDVDKVERNRLIDLRLETRIKEGMIDEVKTLIANGLAAEDLIYYGLEYKFITLHLLGELTLTQMKEKLAIAIHQFAKRQMTWFRGMERKGMTIHWTKTSRLL